MRLSDEALTDALLDELEPLALFHHAELFGDETPFFFNRPLLAALAQADAMVAVLLRDGPKIVGYCGFMIGPMMSRPETCAIDAGLFIDRAHRGGPWAAMMVLKAINRCRDRGVRYVQIQMPAKAPGHALMKRLGFTQTDIVFGKEV